ncbi:hypothetical protein J2X06_001710 [Lysobacter niastensis]|uniref:RepB-like DNA primase domain-containing protein n=1 Tax=Lysobacter niastensis TaxID=380629 RepID=A0ABU1WA81_9GAMM|nr:DNA-primase RepB domain-containing protein [Lysobacter niastensis]MDR7134526.1 hypothetical protein [Lysobacter niastensis]
MITGAEIRSPAGALGPDERQPDQAGDIKHLAPEADLAQTQLFLGIVDSLAQHWNYRTIPERGGGSAHNYTGPLHEVATDLQLDNGNGYGVFVVINEGGHKKADITRVRALWADFDRPALPCTLPLDPHIVVESSPGKYHVYWLVDDVPLDQFDPLQKAIAAHCGSDPSVCDLSRVMRLPGFIHHKGAPFLTRIRRIFGAVPAQEVA